MTATLPPTEKQILLEEAAILERQKKLKEGLPYLYGWKHYKWSREYFESTNYENFLVAANQCGKSSINIRKAIHWATATNLWDDLWNTGAFGKPNQYWYLYPTRDVATIEFKTKWSLFLPANEYKNHPTFGWHAEMYRGQIMALHFNSGVTIYFKTYSQNVTDLQTGTVFAVFCDEELPVPLLPEIQARLNATDGYFHLVFTATLGQDHWRCCMEEVGTDHETHRGACKINVSLYECQEFEDGSPSHWNEEKIKRAIAKCPTEAEVQRRIFGRFVVSGGLVYSSFDRERNLCKRHPIPDSWFIYGGVDVGSGGQTGHPAAIVFIAVSPDYKQGRVFRGWRGDKISTDSGDILKKFLDLRPEKGCQAQVYDYSSADFYTVASKLGHTFNKAEKNHEIGEGILNTLFRHGMLKIFDDDPELGKLIVEITSLQANTPKTKAKDDFCDATRYTVAEIPWDFEAVMEAIDLERFLKKDLKGTPAAKKLSPQELVDKQRETERQEWLASRQGTGPATDELGEWQELYDAV